MASGDKLTVPSSFVVMVPSPSLSNKENASLTALRGRDEHITNESYPSHISHENGSHGGGRVVRACTVRVGALTLSNLFLGELVSHVVFIQSNE